MTKDELCEKIKSLKQAANQFDESEKVFKLSEIDRLEIFVCGLTISDIADKMKAIALPDLETMDQNIQDANDANVAHSQRVEAFNRAYDFIKGVLEII